MFIDQHAMSSRICATQGTYSDRNGITKPIGCQIVKRLDALKHLQHMFFCVSQVVGLSLRVDDSTVTGHIGDDSAECILASHCSGLAGFLA